MARVFMLSLVFGPDTVSTAYMMTDLAHGLQQQGHRVTVLTSMPHYNPSKQVMQNSAYRAKFPRLYTDTCEDGVRVLRVYMPLKRQRIWMRALDYLWFHLITTIVAVLKGRRQDVIFVPSPPITLGLSGYLLALLLRARLIYDVRELWPDVPVRMGLIRNKLLIRLVYAVEHFVYRKAVAITSIAKSFNISLIKRGVPARKLFFTPNFVDVQRLTTRPKSNPFSREYGLDNKFVVFYAGNIGLTQGLEMLVDVARQFCDDPDVVFLVVGDGAGREKFRLAVEASGLRNIQLLPFQPYNCIPDTYATADICISPMRFGFNYDTVPSKIYTAMAAGRPVIVASEPDTEAAHLVEDAGAGIVVTPESADEMADAIRRLRSAPDLLLEMGANARNWITDHYSKEAVIAKYDRVIRQVAAGRRS